MNKIYNKNNYYSNKIKIFKLNLYIIFNMNIYIYNLFMIDLYSGKKIV